MRPFTARVAIAALVLVGLAEVPLPMVPVALLEVELLEVPVEEVEKDDDDETTAAAADTDVDEIEDELKSDVLEAAEVPAPLGAGLASAGLVSAPVPQGMAWPPG